MQRATQKQREEFISIIMQHVEPIEDMKSFAEKHGSRFFFGTSSHVWFAQRLMYFGATLGRIAERQCNGYQTFDHKWDEKASERDARKEERIIERVKELCEDFGCKPVFQGDPRGNTLKIAVPDGYTDDGGREGICVPTS